MQTTLSQQQQDELIARRPKIMAEVEDGDGGNVLAILEAHFGIIVKPQAINYYKQKWASRVRGEVGPNEPYYLYAFEKAATLRKALRKVRREVAGI